MTILTVGFVVLVVLYVLLLSDVRELMASVSDTRFRLSRLERFIFQERVPDRLPPYPNKWKPWAR